MTSQIIYEGDLRTVATHLQSETHIETDAPTDNQGRGERFSPTDLVATALGTCMMTVMGIKARDMGVDLKGTTIDITKTMASNPRRIVGIEALVHFPQDHNADEKQKAILENTALTCPVFQSLHPEIKQDIRFDWR